MHFHKFRHILFPLFLILFFCTLPCCTSEPLQTDYRKAMREFIISLSQYGKSQKKGFLVIPQNGQEVAWSADAFTGEYTIPSAMPDSAYIAAIDGTGREDTFYGYDSDGAATSNNVTCYFTGLCDIYKLSGKKVLSIDYCKVSSGSSTNTAATKTAIEDSCKKNNTSGYICYPSLDRNLGTIPTSASFGTNGCFPYNSNSNNITALSDAKNFLYVLQNNYSAYSDQDQIITSCTGKTEFLAALAATDYDIIVMDAYYSESEPFTAAEISSLKTKACGGTRLVISYMSIGEAEDYRWYWQNSWKTGAPSFLAQENPDWAGNYKVKYWDSDWQNIIYGNDNSYLKKIIDAGFDGVYLDIVDAFEYFE